MAQTPKLEIEMQSFDEQLKEVGNNKPQFRLIVVNAKSASFLRAVPFDTRLCGSLRVKQRFRKVLWLSRTAD
jgi:hypothetical protein